MIKLSDSKPCDFIEEILTAMLFYNFITLKEYTAKATRTDLPEFYLNKNLKVFLNP